MRDTRVIRMVLPAVLLSPLVALGASAAAPPRAPGIPADARYACPMETHPDEPDPAHQGPYFSPDAGRCPWCGMTLKPLDTLAWVGARRAAGGSDVAYTCPTHQHVFSRVPGACPRCRHDLAPFKVMYTCPDPRHARQISIQAGRCPECGRTLVPYRGIWLAPEMAALNTPPDPTPAASAKYRCPAHPLAHSNTPGKCPICAADLVAGAAVALQAGATTAPAIPADAQFVCPMEECWQFSSEPGECPKCGMQLKPIEAVPWARDRRAKADVTLVAANFVCPMHPEQRSAARGTCSICGMQLVETQTLRPPTGPSAAIAAQVDYLMEHYLALQQRFASDNTREVALHALGLVGAADEILKRSDDPAAQLPAAFTEAVRALRDAALKTNGKDLDADRVTFVDLGAAMKRVIEHVRPSTTQYPKLYLFHCPMTKGDWIQTTDNMANPFYGFAMLKCGEQTDVK